jgi:hypothetical protein
VLRHYSAYARSDRRYSYDLSPRIPRTQLDRVLASEEVRGLYGGPRNERNLKLYTFSDISYSSSSTSSSYSCSQVPIGNWSGTSPTRQQKFLRNWPRHYNEDLRGKCSFTVNAFVRLMQAVTGISSFPTSSYKGLVLCPFSCSTSESLSPVRLCGCLSLVHLEVCSPPLRFRCGTNWFVDFAELNAPPMINYGVVYPQAILVFVMTLLYSVVQPLIVIFGAIYFGVAYVVYKYKLLFG